MTSPGEASPASALPSDGEHDGEQMMASAAMAAPLTASTAHTRQTLDASHSSMRGASQTAVETPIQSGEEPISTARRALRLARASVAILRYKGPLAVAERVGLWLGGERGYALRDIREMQDLGMDYQQWFLAHRATPAELEAQRARSAERSAQGTSDTSATQGASGTQGARDMSGMLLRPLVSFVVPVYNPPPRILAMTIESVLAQTYDHWELCLVDGASTTPGVRETLQRYADRDPRIHVTWLDENRGIAGNSNAALAAARGEFVTLLDHDDLIEPDLLYHVVEAISARPDVDVVYYDEDLVTRNGATYKRLLFKPEWSPDLLVSTPLLTHATLRRQVVLDAGGFDSAFDGAQDWDLFLRIAERTDRVARVPHVLYHWRMAPGSAAADSNAKPYVYARQLTAIERHLQRLGAADATAVWARANVPRVVWTPQPTHVSIIIPTRDKVAVLRRCVDSILTRTVYQGSYELILVDTGSVEPATHAYYDTLSASLRDDPRVSVSVVQYEGPFNYSRACNLGAQHATGASLLFLNNDVEVLDADWLEELVRWSNLPTSGVVGAKLLYPHRRIQHAGVLLGASGIAGHLYYGSPEHGFSILGSMDWYRNCSAVTGALHMMRREVYDAVGGYDERYEISYSDVAICLKAIERGYRVLYDPFVCLLHYESQSRSDRQPSQHDKLRAGEDFGAWIERGDPYFSPHLSYRSSWPRLRRDDEPSRAALYEALTGVPLSALVSGPADGRQRNDPGSSGNGGEA